MRTVSDGVSKTELVRLALVEVGEASHQELADFIERRHGVRIDPKFLPVVRASVRELERPARARQAARAVACRGGLADEDQVAYTVRGSGNAPGLRAGAADGAVERFLRPGRGRQRAEVRGRAGRVARGGQGSLGRGPAGKD